MKSSSNDIVEISLIINDATSTKIQLNISKASNELITQLCDDLAQRFTLNEKTKRKLFNHICKELSLLQEKRERKQAIEHQRNQHFDHLYYDYTAKMQERDNYYKKLHQENQTKEISQCSFTPSINPKSSQLYKRDYQRIEDKLYRDAKVLGNKRLNRHKLLHAENQLPNDSVNQIEDAPKKLQPRQSKEVKRIEESKDNDAVLTDRVYTETPVRSNDRSRKGVTAKVQESYVEKFKNQRNSFNQIAVQGNADTNNTNNNDYINKGAINSGKKGIVNPIRKNTSIPRTKMNLSLENDQQLLTAKASKQNSNKAIEYQHTTSNNNKNKSRDKEIQSSPSYSFSVNNPKDNWVKRKVKSQSKLTIQKENEMNKMYQAIYPFKPNISKSSRAMVIKKGKENKDSLFKRLSDSKRAHSVRNALNELHSISMIQPISNNKSTSIRNTSVTANSKKKIAVSKPEAKPIRTEANCETAITTNPQTTSFTERRKKSTEVKQKIEIIQSMREMEQKESNNTKHYKNQYVVNLEKFKLNQLKEIYEILTRNGEEVDVEALTANGVPQHIKEKVIVPTCYMINNKNLEFNFQNFYLIASEILTKFF